MRARIFGILLFPCCIVANARKSAAQDSVHFALRSFVPRPGIDSEVVEAVRAARGRVHLLVQLERSLSDRERSEINETMRLRIVQTLSPVLYIASIEGGTIRGTRPIGVRWVGLLAARDKLAAGIPRSGPAPVPARPRGDALLAMFHPDVAPADQQAVLQRHGATRLGRVGAINAWEFFILRDSISGLSGEDAVKWIEPAPVFGKGDNELARSITGINADAVLTPSLYGLSGNGVTMAYWDGSIPIDHLDFGGRMVNADPLPIPWFMRNLMHADDVQPNGVMDPGETLYVDMDDSESITPMIDGKPGATDFQPVPSTATPAPLFFFGEHEKFVDTDGNRFYDVGEAMYFDADHSGTLTAGDILLAGTAVTPPAVFTKIRQNFHGHSTLVVGSMIGDGSGSSSARWKGMAPAASVSARGVCKDADCTNWLTSFNSDLLTIQTLAGIGGSAHPWSGQPGCHAFVGPVACYGSVSTVIDAFASNKNYDGTPVKTPLTRLLITASAGNEGYPERHSEIFPADGFFQAGEAIYQDMDGDGVVTNSIDSLRTDPATGVADGTPLVDFRSDERHVIDATDLGRFRAGRGIYRDVDGNGKVSAGDRRLQVSGFASPVVFGGQADIGLPLTSFVLWGNVQIYMAAKNTLQVGAVPSDGMAVPAFSSRGPTQDGRMKPELVAAGTQLEGTHGVTSTYLKNGYASAYGTSMSTGVAGGAVALLNEWYRTSCASASTLSPELIRALFVHTADDLVDARFYAGAGPDYSSGFGRMRVKDAVDLTAHHIVGSLAGLTSTYTTTITIPRTRPLKVTLAWSDAAWDPSVGPGPHGILDNDLDLLLVGPDGRQYGPWILDPKHPELPATRSSYTSGTSPTREVRNTIEQVVVDDAAAGTWTVKVSAGLMKYGPQSFALVSEAFSPASSPCATTPSGDVWVRDNDMDVGTTPSSNPLYLGPDLWNRTAADGVSEHQNPQFGQRNFLYANIRNRGANTVVSTTVELWLGDASTGLIWPTSYTYVGRVVVPNLTPGEVRQVGPVAWSPPAPGHYCMYMRLLSAQDPLTSPEGASVMNNARNNNNIAYRNLTVVELNSAAPEVATFFLRNVDAQPRDVDLAIRVPAALLQAARVEIAMSSGLHGVWTRRDSTTVGLTRALGVALIPPSGPQPPGGPAFAITGPEVVLSGFRLRPQQTERVTLTFSSARRDTMTFNVDVEQRVGNEVVGGIRYVVRTGRR